MSQCILQTARSASQRLASAAAAARSAPSPRLFSSCTAYHAATTRAPAATEPYPFSSAVQTFTNAPTTPAPPRGDSLLRTLNAHLSSQHPKADSYLPLFSRRADDRIRPGSVLTVTSYATAPTPENPSPATTVFSGVLIGIRRRHAGRDTSIRLRNLVGRTGVEMVFKVLSPLVKDIKVVQRAETSGPPVVAKDGSTSGPRRKPALKAARRAKMYFVRRQPDRLVSVAGIVKQAREREANQSKRR
ncbi:hypothetical protein JCM8115_002133 [Rhodotorula mucilaginosa]|uniref:Ribosomal protein L19 n=1 Tax=Rhodotorula mucilaginosa TaxID=5537 RepID=A0A9P6W3I4_RHOMI|nr:hypothetical protein C6P46_004017 [Rhodotorula mucilaginosa]TKA56841.1 hypothetical protein B0A53_01242 [Rhodotorula sp. CCFEE 5036]